MAGGRRRLRLLRSAPGPARRSGPVAPATRPRTRPGPVRNAGRSGARRTTELHHTTDRRRVTRPRPPVATSVRAPSSYPGAPPLVTPRTSRRARSYERPKTRWEAGDTPSGICIWWGSAADPLLAVVLVGLGATTLSMSPSALADVRTELARFTLDEARLFAELALSANSAVEARGAVTTAAASL